ncbi:MAG: response regulator [Caulobacteraceae bacterium]
MTTVLIVDDSKLARIVIGKALSALRPQWRRLEAANAEEASAVIETDQVDALVLDFNMPGRNGLELAEELRARFADMPIALATANVQDEVIGRARAARIAFVPKPVTEDGLRSFTDQATQQLRDGPR